MNMQRLRAFQAIMESGSVTSAAEELKRKVDALKHKLEHEDALDFWANTRFKLHKTLDRMLALLQLSGGEQQQCAVDVDVLCYGLGSVDDIHSSRHQLALLLLVLDELRKTLGVRVQLVECFDPMFSRVDVHLLRSQCGFRVPEANERCVRRLDDSHLTVAYMPHCGRALYNNLLYANWCVPRLRRLLLIGNSFATMTSNGSNMVTYSYVADAMTLVDEVKLANTSELTSDAFYDLSLHTFARAGDDHNERLLVNKLLPIAIGDMRDYEKERSVAPVYGEDERELM